MNRFEFALDAASNPLKHSLADHIRAIAAALEHIETEKGVVEEDPAILVIGSFISFHTHADINTFNGFTQLLDLCARRMSGASTASFDPNPSQMRLC